MKKIVCLFISVLVIFFGASIFVNAEDSTEEINTYAVFSIKSDSEAAIKDDISYILVIQNLETKEKYQYEITEKNNSGEYELLIPLKQGIYEIKKIKTTSNDFTASLDESAGTAFMIGNISRTVVPINIKCSIPLPSFIDLLKNNALILFIAIGAIIGLVVIKKRNEKEI